MSVRALRLLASICGLGLFGCGADAALTSDFAAGESSCASALMPLPQRAGDLGLMSLSYECGGITCTGDESFAEGSTFQVRLELPLDMTQRFTLESDDEDAFRARVLSVENDECAEQTRVLASISALKAGVVQLMLLRNDEPFDTVEIQIERAASLDLRASTLEEFAFGESGGTVTTRAGSPVVVMARLLDADGELLLGTPELKWKSLDPRVAVIRQKAETSAEELVALATAQSAVFVDATGAGTATIEARTEYDVAASVEVLVEESPSANASPYAASVLR